MSSLERVLVAGVFFVLLFLGHIYLAGKTLRKTRHMTELFNRIAFSNSSLLTEDSHPEYVFDRNTETFWSENFYTNPSSTGIPDSSSWGAYPFLQTEISLSHFPGDPPLPNPIKSISVQTGSSPDLAHFRDYARPRKIRLIFYYQKLVDVDRDYQLPGMPQTRAYREFLLNDTPEKQDFMIDFLPPPEASRKFPENISLIWMRMEILAIYPGSRYPDTVAVSEIDYHTEIEDH